jgi:hypothetical protein
MTLKIKGKDSLMRVVLLDLDFRPANQSTRAHNNTVVIRAIMVRKIAL